MTLIVELPEGRGPCVIDLTEDWRDPVIFTDANGNPLSLDGISFSAKIKNLNDPNRVFMTLSTDNGTIQIVAGTAKIAVQNAGLNHAVGDVLSLAGGNYVDPARLTITAVGPLGTITAARMSFTGFYTSLPQNPVAQARSSGQGTGAAFNLTFINNALMILVPAAQIPSGLVAGSYIFKIQATADGITKNVATVDLTAS